MKRSWSRIFALTMGIPLLLAILAACGSGTTSGSGTTPTAQANVTIKIASSLPVSGKDESSGKPAQNGAQLAVDQANANHTIPNVTLVFDPKDDVGPSGLHDPTVGAANVTALESDAEVAGIVGPFNSSVAKAEMPITNQAPIVQISPANTNPCLTKDTAASGCSGANNLIPTLRPTGKVNYFRIATTDDHQGPAGADYLYKQNIRKIYVIDDAETYGIGIANAFIGEWKNLGGTVLGHSSEPSTTTSYVSLLTQIAAMHPDGIYFGGLDSTGGILIKQQMKQVPGLQSLPFGGGDGIVTPTFATTIQPLGGGAVDGTVAVVDTSTNPNAATFRQQYAAAFPSDPINVYSAAAYDCANILIQAVKTTLANGMKAPTSSSDSTTATTFRTAVIAAVQAISYDGITGHQSFDTNGDTNLKVISIYELGLNTSGKPDWLYKSAVNVTS
ncbi:MAG TPA: branched-chain amino acid ABC transporter substrate-binding protein [Ktedonobacteraceae bacterium]|nr:branched-chain amino acid ABC transporter substrate-binding protein [Ktedonobacteraceae bacterium]